ELQLPRRLVPGQRAHHHGGLGGRLRQPLDGPGGRGRGPAVPGGQAAGQRAGAGVRQCRQAGQRGRLAAAPPAPVPLPQMTHGGAAGSAGPGRAAIAFTPHRGDQTMKWRHTLGIVGLVAAVLLAGAGGPVEAQQPKPNIIMIMGDDIGIWNIGAYHRGMMASRTPSLDRLAAEGMIFTDYYAEASCTAGRANFVTGEIPFRTGLTTVGQAGST